MARRITEGCLLVAEPGLLDPNFYRSVVLICRYDAEQGAVGLVLNRRTRMPVCQALADVEEASERNEPLWLGGPVDGRNLWVLHRREDLALGGHEVMSGVYFTPDANVVRALLRTNPPDESGAYFRLFVGYTGWAAGQLEQELEEEAWTIAPSTSECLFSDEPRLLWREMSLRSLLPCGDHPEYIDNARYN